MYISPVHERQPWQGTASLVSVAQELAHYVGGVLVGAVGAVGVDLHRGRAVGVSQSCGHGRHWHAGIQSDRSTGASWSSDGVSRRARI